MPRLHKWVTMTRQWHAIRIRPGAEGKAHIGLCSFGWCPFLPVETVPRWLGHRTKRILGWRPLIPGYLFVHIDPAREHLSQLHDIEGVIGILRVDGRLSPIAPECIEALQVAVRHGMFDRSRGIYRPFTTGDLVRVQNGPFGKMLAKIKSARPHRRLELVGDFPFRLTIDAGQLEKISA